MQAAAELYRGQGVQDVRVVIYPNMRHEILNEPRRADVYNDVEQWFTECMVMNAVVRKREVAESVEQSAAGGNGEKPEAENVQPDVSECGEKPQSPLEEGAVSSGESKPAASDASVQVSEEEK